MSLAQIHGPKRPDPSRKRPSLLAACGFFSLLCAILLTCNGVCRAGAPLLLPLSAPPTGERWFSVSMNDDRRGFGYLKIAATPTGYEVVSEGSARIVVLGFTRQAASRERYLVHRDLSLESFAVEEIIDGRPLLVTGEVTPKGVRVVAETAGEKHEKLLKVKGAVYPAPLLNVYPLVKGVAPGRQYRLQMLDVEELKIKKVTIKALGRETLPGGVETVHLRSDLYPFVDNDVWVDLAGNTVMESVRDDLVVTRAEDAQSAAAFIAEAAVAKRDLILDFSLVRVTPPLVRPREARGMVVVLSGIPAEFPLPEGAGQKGERLTGGSVRITTVSSVPPQGASPAAVAGNGRYLEATARVQADNPAIIALKGDILGDEKEPLRVVEKLASWTAAQVKESKDDGRSPIETLASHTGNCQAHARLYASLARAAGIPTRVVAGLVYVEGKGFLYHSWAESLVGEWVAVEPTFGDVPADATHIKLVEGDAPEDMFPLTGIVGRVKAKVEEVRYRDQDPTGRISP